MTMPQKPDALIALLETLDVAGDLCRHIGLGDARGYGVPVPRARAVEAWHAARGVAERTGFWPVLRNAADYQDDLDAAVSALNAELEDIDPATALAQSTTIDPQAWIRQQEEEEQTWRREHPEWLSPEDWARPLEGEWPEDTTPSAGFYIAQPNRYAAHPHAPLLLDLVPTTCPWEVPAYRPFGGWNEVPDDPTLIAFLRRWHDLYGADLAVMTTDILEFHVARPPRTREAALQLAREQYAVCADIVDQGTETISNLAATLLGGTSWFFWWD